MPSSHVTGAQSVAPGPRRAIGVASLVGELTNLKPSRPGSHIHQRLTSWFSRGVIRRNRPPREPIVTLQPRAQPVQTDSVKSMNQTRLSNRKSFDVSAPTGQRSMMFMAYGVVNSPRDVMITSSWSLRLPMESSCDRVTSSVKRTQRVHLMHRSMS